jgi:hypothetical protein
MRGAFVSAGGHTLVYNDRPGVLRVGAMIAMAGLLVLGGLVFGAARIRERSPESQGS